MPCNPLKRSSDSVRIRFLEHENILTELKGAAKKLKFDYPSIKCVLLFGSLSREDYSAKSDADILVVFHSLEKPPHKMISLLLPYFDSISIPVDIIPVDEEGLKKENRFIRRILSEGIELV